MLCVPFFPSHTDVGLGPVRGRGVRAAGGGGGQRRGHGGRTVSDNIFLKIKKYVLSDCLGHTTLK